MPNTYLLIYNTFCLTNGALRYVCLDKIKNEMTQKT